MLWVRFLSKNCKTQALRSLSSVQFLPCSRFHRSLWFPGSSEQMWLKSLLILFYVICQYVCDTSMSHQRHGESGSPKLLQISTTEPQTKDALKSKRDPKGSTITNIHYKPEFILFCKHFTDIHIHTVIVSGLSLSFWVIHVAFAHLHFFAFIQSKKLS